MHMPTKQLHRNQRTCSEPRVFKSTGIFCHSPNTTAAIDRNMQPHKLFSSVTLLKWMSWASMLHCTSLTATASSMLKMIHGSPRRPAAHAPAPATMMPMETTSKALMRCGFGRKSASTSEKNGDGTRNTTTMLIGACSNATMEVARRQSGRTLGPSSDPLQCHHSREVPGMLQLDASQHDFVWHVLECTMPDLRDSPQSNEIAFQTPNGREFWAHSSPEKIAPCDSPVSTLVPQTGKPWYQAQRLHTFDKHSSQTDLLAGHHSVHDMLNRQWWHARVMSVQLLTQRHKHEACRASLAPSRHKWPTGQAWYHWSVYSTGSTNWETTRENRRNRPTTLSAGQTQEPNLLSRPNNYRYTKIAKLLAERMSGRRWCKWSPHNPWRFRRVTVQHQLLPRGRGNARVAAHVKVCCLLTVKPDSPPQQWTDVHSGLQHRICNLSNSHNTKAFHPSPLDACLAHTLRVTVLAYGSTRQSFQRSTPLQEQAVRSPQRLVHILHNQLRPWMELAPQELSSLPISHRRSEGGHGSPSLLDRWLLPQTN